MVMADVTVVIDAPVTVAVIAAVTITISETGVVARFVIRYYDYGWA